MFGKLMSISDAQMAEYYRLLLHEEVTAEAHPMEAKKSLAERLTARFHSATEAKRARDEFELRFSKKDLESADLPSYTPSPEIPRDIITLGVDAFERVLGVEEIQERSPPPRGGGSVSWKGEKVTDPKALIPQGEAGVLKLDRRNAVRL